MSNHEPRQGWRFFRCHECGHEWKEASRDAASPSGDDCPACMEGWEHSWVGPYRYEIDPSITVDRFGNLR